MTEKISAWGIFSGYDDKKISAMASQKLARSSRSRKAAGMRASPWRALFQLAATQGGLFHARQADELGCTLKQLYNYSHSG